LAPKLTKDYGIGIKPIHDKEKQMLMEDGNIIAFWNKVMLFDSVVQCDECELGFQP
jgi:hypothetical protein